jgi:AcrR family transcriptional regulator
MATTALSAARRSARERLLGAAEELFYAEGIHTVGIDRIIARAGVAKASLYDCFGSKDELIRAYLEARHAARRARLQQTLATCATPKERLLGVFDAMAESFAEPNFRGCAFVRASAEAKGGSSVASVCDDARTWQRELFLELARDAGVRDAETFAQQMVLLCDGAWVSAQMDRNAGAATAARKVAAMMLDATT